MLLFCLKILHFDNLTIAKLDNNFILFIN